MTTNRYQDVRALISDAGTIRDDTRASFGSLSRDQLNWKPSPEKWSIAQCLDHLMSANGAYFPVFEDLLKGRKQTTFWEQLPWLPGVWGKFLIKAVSPESPRKIKAPQVFAPSVSDIDGEIVSRFADQQNQVIEYITA